MRTTWIALLISGVLWAEEASRSRFDQLKAEARTAASARDWTTAEARYQEALQIAAPGLEKGLAQADLGFFYQAGDFSSADQFHGERLIDEAIRSFEQCSSIQSQADECRKRFASTAGVQGAMFYQRRDYDRAEPLFRKVIALPEVSTPEEIMLVSLHALGGILTTRKEFKEAEKIQARAAAFESSHPNALRRLKQEGTRSRKR